jgi:putative membrane protein
MLATTATALAVWAARSGGVALSSWIPVVVVLVGVPVAVAAAELRYRRLGHALTQRYLVSCTGTLTATRTALEIDGIVGWRLHQSFWDRRRGLAQLTATTAAGQEQVAVPDVPVREAVAVAAAATPRMLERFLAGADGASGDPFTATVTPS